MPSEKEEGKRFKIVITYYSGKTRTYGNLTRAQKDRLMPVLQKNIDVAKAEALPDSGESGGGKERL